MLFPFLEQGVLILNQKSYRNILLFMFSWGALSIHLSQVTCHSGRPSVSLSNMVPISHSLTLPCFTLCLKECGLVAKCRGCKARLPQLTPQPCPSQCDLGCVTNLLRLSFFICKMEVMKILSSWTVAKTYKLAHTQHTAVSINVSYCFSLHCSLQSLYLFTYGGLFPGCLLAITRDFLLFSAEFRISDRLHKYVFIKIVNEYSISI